MFGYIIVNKPELKIKDFDLYRSFYCGVCKKLHTQYGRIGQMSLNYDMTFLALLLSGLYEPVNEKESRRCIAQPIKKHDMTFNDCSVYAADMTILLTYLKCEDDWEDDRRYRSMAMKSLLHNKFKSVRIRYPKKVENIQTALSQIHDLEKSESEDLDALSKLFGIVMGEIFVYKDDIWKDQLYEMGMYLGRFIYLMDAYDDIEDDMEKKNFNPFINRFQKEDFEEDTKWKLELMISQCCDVFERLPILEYVDILRNILYSGIWSKYEAVRKRRLEAHG